MIARTTSSGPAHHVIAGRSICGGAQSVLPAGDAPMCRQCEHLAAKRRAKGEGR